MKILFVHGVDHASTNFARNLADRVFKITRKTTHDITFDSLVWSDATSSIINDYEYMQPIRPYFWSMLTDKIDPLAIQVLHYVDSKKDNSILDDVDRDFRRAIGDEKDLVIVAHSLGSVIMFDYLFGFGSKKPPVGLRIRLITVGSPLPIFWAAMGHFTLPKYPKRIKKWLNVYSPRDAIARPMSSYDVDEIEVRTAFLPIRAHVRYWKNRKLARIVAEESTNAN